MDEISVLNDEHVKMIFHNLARNGPNMSVGTPPAPVQWAVEVHSPLKLRSLVLVLWATAISISSFTKKQGEFWKN